MARVQIPFSFSYPSGTVYAASGSGGSPTTALVAAEPVVGATVTVTIRSNGNPATVYVAETGASTYSSITTDSGGNVPGWVDPGSYKISVAAVGAFSGAVANFDAVRGDGVTNIAAGAVGASQLASGAVGAAAIANGAVGTAAIANGAVGTTQIGASAGILDTQLASPNNGVRRLLLHGTGHHIASETYAVGGEDHYLMEGWVTVGGAVTLGISQNPPPALWLPDSGIGGNPTDFQVAGKSPKGRIRVAHLEGAHPNPGTTFVYGLYQITSINNVGGGNTMSYFGTVIPGTTVTIAPSTSNNQIYMAESAEFALPTSGNPCFLGFNISGGAGSFPSNSSGIFTAQLYGYNA